MRRLTLILSDLYLPEEARDDAVGANPIALPHLEWLLRFAASRVAVRDWRAWLPRELGRGDLAALAPAQLVARDLVPAEQAATCALATPMHLETRLDHVRLSDRGLLRINAEERAAWCADFARSFGPHLTLHDVGARGFLLAGLASTNLTTVDPARLIGADVANAQPRGPDSVPVRRLAAEIEMWMHAAPLNSSRELMRLPRISALWLWGLGARADFTAPVAEPRNDDLFFAGDDLFLVALSRACTGAAAHAAPGSFAEISSAAAHAIVELTPVSDGAGALARVDVNWFGPARTALSRGELDLLEVVANDRRFLIQARAGWRFWRRRMSWLDLLKA